MTVTIVHVAQLQINKKPVTFKADQYFFEIYQPGPKDVLRAFLASCVESCIVSWKFVRSLGFSTTPTLIHKLPYYRAALRQPNQVLFDYRVQRTLEITALPFNSVLADRLPHRRPRYWRDKTFGAGFVMPLNIFLGWLLVSADLVNLQL